MDMSLRVNSVRKQMLPVAVQVEFMQLTFFRDVWPSSRVTTFGRERLQLCNHLHYNRPKSLTATIILVTFCLIFSDDSTLRRLITYSHTLCSQKFADVGRAILFASFFAIKVYIFANR